MDSEGFCKTTSNGLCEQQVSANGFCEQQVYANGISRFLQMDSAGFFK